MACRFPLRLKVTRLDEPQEKAHPVGVFFDVLDADDAAVLAGQHFYTMPENVEMVAAYTLERLTQALLTERAGSVVVSDEHAGKLAAMKEQRIAPVGIEKGTVRT